MIVWGVLSHRRTVSSSIKLISVIYFRFQLMSHHNLRTRERELARSYDKNILFRVTHWILLNRIRSADQSLKIVIATKGRLSDLLPSEGLTAEAQKSRKSSPISSIEHLRSVTDKSKDSLNPVKIEVLSVAKG